MTAIQRRGPSHLREAAAQLLASAVLKDVTSFIGPQTVSRQAGVSAGTVTHHFPKSEQLAQEALRQALTSVGDAELQELASRLRQAVDQVRAGRHDGLEAVARRLEWELGRYSPEGGEADPRFEAEETAWFLAGAVAPCDEVARDLLRLAAEPLNSMTHEIVHELMAATDRGWQRGVDDLSFTTTVNALASGFLSTRRFNLEGAPLSLYSEMVVRLFECCTTPSALPPVDYREALLFSPEESPLDIGKREAVARAALAIYQSTKDWKLVTIAAGAERAGVSRPTVMANFGDRGGLVSAIWAMLHLPGLRLAADRTISLPVGQALHRALWRLAEPARSHRQLTGAMLEGVFVYTVAHGRPDPETPPTHGTLCPSRAYWRRLSRSTRTSSAVAMQARTTR